jgi:hypothetical protein
MVRAMGAVALFVAGILAPAASQAASAALPAAGSGAAIGVQIGEAQMVPSPAGAAGDIQIQASIEDPLDQPIEIETGCGAGPALLLQLAGGAVSYRAVPVLPPVREGCHTQPVIIKPGSSQAGTYEYAPRGYGSGGVSVASAIPAGVYALRLVVTYRVVTDDVAQRYRTLADGHLLDTWPAHWSASASVPLSIAASGPSAQTVTTSAAPASFTPKVLVIDFNTSGAASDGSAALTSELAAALSSATHYHGASAGSGQFQIYATHTENTPPPIVAGTNKGDGTGKGDYAAIFSKYGICNLAATQGVNFVWIWAAGTEAGGPFYAGDFFEWVATGPTFNETYGSNVPNCGHTVITMGLNYSRDVALAVHSHGHYMENLLGYSFGPIDDSGPGAKDMYDLFDTQFYRYSGVTAPLNTTQAGCGDVHYPPNTTQAYDYTNSTVVQSDCAAYDPGRPALVQYAPVSVSTWQAVGCDASIKNNTFDCDQESYLLWWMQNMPGAGNSALDCAQAPMPNWWQYILALDTVAGTTSNNCAHVAAVTASPHGGPAGSTTTVSASGFSGSEPVSLYWDSPASSPILTAGASNGAIGATITIPPATAGSHTIFVKGASSGVLGSVPFTVQTAGSPGAPGKAIVTSASPGMNSATLSWLAASDGGSPITGYTTSCLPPAGSSSPPGSVDVDGSTLTATVTGLANGTAYTCIVTAINANARTASDPAVITPGTAQPIEDAGFESGLSPWVPSSLQGRTPLDTTAAHSGDASVRLCGSNGCNDGLAQTVTLPADPLSATLSFWLSMSTQERAGTCYDTLAMQLRSTTGAILQSFPAVCPSATNGWVQKTLTVNPSVLSAHAGGTVQVYVRGATNAAIPTTFSLDDFALTITTAGGAANLLANADLENGLASWSSSSTQGHTLLSAAAAHSPTHSVHFCGSNSCSDAVWQTVMLPSGSLSGTLSYWIDIATQERTAICYDKLSVQLRTGSGSTFLSAPAVCQSNTGGWVHKTVTLSSYILSSHAGQPVQLYLRAGTNASNPTDFYLDDVVLSITAR